MYQTFFHCVFMKDEEVKELMWQINIYILFHFFRTPRVCIPMHLSTTLQMI